MTKFYANISVGHENRMDILEKRLITAAQCNVDAVVINKSTPTIMVPAEKKYVSISSRWGNLPFFEVATLGEISKEHAERLTALASQIGIPIIWSVTDSMAAEFVKDYCAATTVKLHSDAVHVYELSRFCKNNFKDVIYHHTHNSDYDPLYGKQRKNFVINYSTVQFPPSVDQLNFHIIDQLMQKGHRVGYESREIGLFPSVALAYRGVEYIEKYLGDDDSDNASILTPEQFYEYFKNLELMEIANGKPST